MKVILDGHSLRYETGNLCFLFFPGVPVEICAPGTRTAGDDFIVARIRKRRARAVALVYIQRGGRHQAAICPFNQDAPDFEKQCKIALGRAFYQAASSFCGFRPPWGILTGIRPVKLMREKLASGMTAAQAIRLFENRYLTSPQKAELCAETAAAEEKITALSRPESFSLYLSIPFCPSRCAYCSFVSQDVEKSFALLPDYVRLLCREIEETGRIADQLHLRLETVYMGGGTPTVLSAQDLATIFECVKKSFTLSAVREYTVEAGRPDTVTPEKLSALLKAGANRISINPQSMNDTILAGIGRKHTAQDVIDAYRLAVKMGVPSVNMDLIAGLPGDTPEGFARTLKSVAGLRPQAVTVHTLAMKRSSRLVTSGSAEYNARGERTAGMLDLSCRVLHQEGYLPYYLYRQRNSSGNLENVGWSLPSHEGLYNVFIMDETHSILSVGAGGVTKLRQPGGTRIERIFNFKYPLEYIERFPQIIDRKRQVLQIYDTFGWKR